MWDDLKGTMGPWDVLRIQCDLPERDLLPSAQQPSTRHTVTGGRRQGTRGASPVLTVHGRRRRGGGAKTQLDWLVTSSILVVQLPVLVLLRATLPTRTVCVCGRSPSPPLLSPHRRPFGPQRSPLRMPKQASTPQSA